MCSQCSNCDIFFLNIKIFLYDCYKPKTLFYLALNSFLYIQVFVFLSHIFVNPSNIIIIVIILSSSLRHTITNLSLQRQQQLEFKKSNGHPHRICQHYKKFSTRSQLLHKHIHICSPNIHYIIVLCCFSYFYYFIHQSFGISFSHFWFCFRYFTFFKFN